MKIHPICALPLLVCLILSAKGQEPLEEKNVDKLLHPVRPDKELLILDPAVVDSDFAQYPGPFSIGHLFDELAVNGDGASMMREWLETWTRDLNINGSEVTARPAILEKVIEPWQRADGFDPGTGEKWYPNLENAPFRLLAVVNRMDLVSLAPVYYGGGMIVNAKPEGRLVYAVLDEGGVPLGRHFTVIFEYKQQKDQAGVLELAKGWHELGAIEEFDQNYLTKLEALTRSFTDWSYDEEKSKWIAPGIAQVRTNDMALAESCEMREFHLDSKRNVLAPATLANTPSMAFARKGSRNNRVLSAFLLKNAEAAENGDLELPSNLLDRSGKVVPVLVGSTTVPDKKFYWETSGLRGSAMRHNFSMRTCNGCHSGDTNTEFCHISPRLEGEKSEISDFLRMDGRPTLIKDPAEWRRQVKSTEMMDRVEAYIKVLQPTIREAQVKRELRKARVTR